MLLSNKTMTTAMKKYILALMSAAVLFGCTDNFEDYNTDGTGLTEEQINAGIKPIELYQPLQHEISHDYQTAQNLGADAFAGYMMSPTRFLPDYNLNYALVDGWNNNAFKGMYTYVLQQINTIASFGIREKNPDLWAIALIIKVESMHRVTDKFGPIPYSQIGVNVATTPYDDEAVLYNQFFAELDTAVNTLQAFVENPANADNKPFANADLFYAGDYTKWIKFANSLRLRLAMHIVKAAPSTAKTQGEKALSHPGGLMTTPADDAARKVTNGISDLYQITASWDDNRINATIVTYLLGYNDPRLPAYASKATVPGFDGDYVGIRLGTDIEDRRLFLPYSSLNTETTFTQTRAQQLMSAAEVWFLKSESALRNWAGAGDAQANYEQGVKVSMQQWGVEIGNYLSNTDSTQADFKDPLDPTLDINAMSTVTIAWDADDDNERKLERIMTQKWIAMFPEGMEAWTEYRRTGYPKLFPTVVNKSGGTIDTDVQIRRLPYPSAEYKTNGKAVKEAAARLKGADNGGTRLWWDVNKGNF